MDEITRSLKSFSEAIDISSTFSSFTSKAAKSTKPLRPGTDGRQSPYCGAAQGGDSGSIGTSVLDENREAALKRAELALQQLDQGYFSQAFDPLAHELSQLAEDSKQDDVDAVVERLTAAVDVSAWQHIALPLLLLLRT